MYRPPRTVARALLAPVRRTVRVLTVAVAVWAAMWLMLIAGEYFRWSQQRIPSPWAAVVLDVVAFSVLISTQVFCLLMLRRTCKVLRLRTARQVAQARFCPLCLFDLAATPVPDGGLRCTECGCALAEYEALVLDPRLTPGWMNRLDHPS